MKDVDEGDLIKVTPINHQVWVSVNLSEWWYKQLTLPQFVCKSLLSPTKKDDTTYTERDQS